MIRVENLNKRFGGVLAINDVSLEIETGAITGLIGPNGAGKTTLFNIIAGAYPPTSGRVLLDGIDITGMPPHERYSLGLLRTFQIAHEFSSLSVEENLMAVAANQEGERLLGAWLKPRKVGRQEVEVRRRAQEVIDFLQLREVATERAGNLSGGQKKLLELGRTMMQDARVVLLDEIGAGVNRTLLRSIARAIFQLNAEHGYTFCMIEHDMEFISLLCDPVIVLAAGTVLTRGPAPAVRADERVIECYLGRGTPTRGKRA